MNKTALLLAISLVGSSILAQNWAARMYESVSVDDPLRQLNIPTNWMTWINIGDKTNVQYPLVFVGDLNAREQFQQIRYSEYTNWYQTVWIPFDALQKSNNNFTVTNNIGVLNLLFNANANFVDLVNSGTTIGPVLQSNQVVRSARILKQLEPILKNLYLGE